jgi:DNA-directed RNA polymerase subunit F
MIKERTPLAMYEVSEQLSKLKETDRIKDMNAFIEKFAKLTPEKSKELKNALESLNMIKLKRNDIVKIVDVTPDNATELNKIFSDTSLDADETNKILETIKKHK